ncbi:transmembrane protein 198-like [Takifugu flavidus]|uniref:transmembrane protein 198-like n=1 Tax=Takifugu flavidus TaxID=433684 RepID=UPI0025447665|nr:transmembrane protein 198-like [Takifugu flavidus]XP_056896235.1 transmembrane protein 198-like [Takifugu flavidus]XP_056896236.1 transmembrane protein 198-like [Takifugu flavidus]
MAASSLYITAEPGAGSAEVDTCTLEINSKYEVVTSIVCSAFFSLGFIYCFFGYRCFKMVMFFSGFTLSSAATLLLYHKEPILDSRLRTETKVGISLGMGVLCGLMTMLVSTIGLLLSGLQLGGLLSLALLVVIGQFHSLTPVWVPLGTTLVLSVVAAIFTLHWQKFFTVVYTSVFGAALMMLCVDYLLGTFVLPDQVHDMLCEVAPRPFCWFNWVIAGIWPLMSLVGAAVQWSVTARGVTHTASHYKHKKYSKKHKYRESRRRHPAHRRRRPPPLKRYAGDVLAPSYLRRLQEHQMGTGSSTSSVSTITHTLIDFDFETGSMVPLTAASPTFTI